MSMEETFDSGDAGSDASEGASPDPNALKRVAALWIAGLAFGGLTYVGATNQDVSPTVLGELVFGSLATVLFLAGLYVLLRG